ncbi:hypothetical protein HDU89_000449 [Geranomyces variabilis]|nr:hypothetical protein BDZ88DRAFT_455885 [Geranomyces variabilis]KAJ3136122.1 hypothetical protein HDU90_003525 [Geranomyces variabilis]KAJ3158066.1 hypothetical protein HDU89_000449 [Geranomyces variabilis]KAJ3165075.1 hypothetical protein HDU88_004794 [Geranomyces variabilis]
MYKRIPFLPDNDGDDLGSLLLPAEILDEQQQDEVIKEIRDVQISSGQGYESAGRFLGLLGSFLFIFLIFLPPANHKTQHAFAILACLGTVFRPRTPPQWLGVALLSVLPFLIHVGLYEDSAFLDTLTALLPGLVVLVNLYIGKAGQDIGYAVSELDALRYGFKGA